MAERRRLLVDRSIGSEDLKDSQAGYYYHGGDGYGMQ